MEWEASETSSDSHAENSIVWLLGWALILPFLHPGRLLTYVLAIFILLMVLTILYPAASVFAPILVSSNYDPQPPSILSHGPVLGGTVLVLSTLSITLLACIWQRDIVHRFQDPLGPLLTSSFRLLPQHLIASLLLAGFLIAFAFLQLSAGPIGLGIGSLILGPIYARLAFLGPVIVSQGLKVALPLAWRAGKGHGLGHALVYALMGLCWFGTLSLLSLAGVKAAIEEHNLLPMLLTDCTEVAVTFIFVLWMMAVPALIVRRRVVLHGIDTTVFD